MDAIDNYLWAMDDGKTISSQKEILVYSLRCATKMKKELKDYILKFNESERLRVYNTTMHNLWKMSLDHLIKAPRIDPNNIEFYKIVGDGFIRCLLRLRSEMKEELGFECFLDEKISILEGEMKEREDLALDLLFDPIMMNAYFDKKEEKTPGETIPQETPGETIPQETPGETIPKKKVGRPRGKSVLDVIIYENKGVAVEVLKECLEGKKGVELARLAEAAIRLKIIKELPSFRSMQEVLGVEGYENALRWGFRNIHDVENLSMQDSIFLESAMSTLKETLDRKQNNHGNN